MNGYYWTEEEKAYLGEITPGRHVREIAELMGEKYPGRFTIGQIKSAISRYHFHTGFTGCFEKGHIPKNKGRKGVCAKGCEKSWFKKGNISINYRSVGSERIDADGYTLIKTGDPSTWQLKHKVIWEKANGKVPKGHALLFLDGNKQNLNLDNLVCVSRYELLMMNRHGLIKDIAELTRLGLKIADIEIKVREFEFKNAKNSGGDDMKCRIQK